MLPKLERETLPERASRALLEYIRREALRPGDALPAETRLAAEFGVSRPVIREALQILRGRGVIDTPRHRQATVSRPSGAMLLGFFQQRLLLERRSVLELLELRRGLEVEAARLAALRSSAAQRAELRATVERMRGVLHTLEPYVELDLLLHRLIAHATGNALLADFVDSIRSALAETIAEGLRSRIGPEEFERLQDAHERVVEAIAKGEQDGAGAAMRFHFDVAIQAVSRQAEVEADRSDPPP